MDLMLIAKIICSIIIGAGVVITIIYIAVTVINTLDEINEKLGKILGVLTQEVDNEKDTDDMSGS